MQTQSLSAQVAHQILDYIAEQGLAEGDRLPERTLAERFRVSRSPVREALRMLARTGAVLPLEKGGFAVQASNPLSIARSNPAGDDDPVYFAIAEDRLSGQLPERVTENYLIRRYGLSRGHLSKLLRRMASEGWLERLPGHGWGFAPVLAAASTVEQSYLFRLEIEPAALLQPTFVLDRPAIERCRKQQMALLAGGLASASPAQLFECNSLLHETVIQCSGNLFFHDALKRINRLRRLIAYRRISSRPLGESQCGEHIRILELLLDGEREKAAFELRQHLELARRRPIT